MSGLEGLFVSPWYWLVGGLVVAGLEIVVAGVFLLWIGLGAMMVGILLLLLPGMPFALQLLLFAVTMLSSVALGFFVQRRGGASVGAGELNHELQALIGRRCEAATDFTAGRGRIRVGDTTYSALGGDDILAGEFVEILSADADAIRVVRVHVSTV